MCTFCRFVYTGVGQAQPQSITPLGDLIHAESSKGAFARLDVDCSRRPCAAAACHFYIRATHVIAQRRCRLLSKCRLVFAVRHVIVLHAREAHFAHDAWHYVFARGHHCPFWPRGVRLVCRENRVCPHSRRRRRRHL